MSDAQETVKHVSIFDMFGTDRNAEENGKWFEFGPDLKIKLRRYKSKHTTKIRGELEKPFERMRVGGQIPQDIMEDIVHQTLVESVVVDWKGLYGTDGQEIPYSKENCDALLKQLTEFRDEITALSIGMDNFRSEDDSATEKN